jgi:hypothetical protein
VYKDGLRAERLKFEFWYKKEIFLFTLSKPTGAHPLQNQWLPEAPSLRVKWPGLEADQSSPSSADIKNDGALYLHSPIRVHGLGLNCLLIKYRDNFTFLLNTVSQRN